MIRYLPDSTFLKNKIVQILKESNVHMCVNISQEINLLIHEILIPQISRSLTTVLSALHVRRYIAFGYQSAAEHVSFFMFYDYL